MTITNSTSALHPPTGRPTESAAAAVRAILQTETSRLENERADLRRELTTIDRELAELRSMREAPLCDLRDRLFQARGRAIRRATLVHAGRLFAWNIPTFAIAFGGSMLGNGFPHWERQITIGTGVALLLLGWRWLSKALAYRELPREEWPEPPWLEVRECIWHALVACSLGMGVLLLGQAPETVALPALLLFGSLLDMYLKSQQLIGRLQICQPLPIHSYLVQRDRDAREALAVIALDGAAPVAPREWSLGVKTLYGSTRRRTASLADGDVLVHLGDLPGQSPLGFALGKGMTCADSVGDEARTTIFRGLTGRWCACAKRTARSAFDAVARTGEAMRPLVSRHLAVQAQVQDIQQALDTLNARADPWNGVFLPEQVVRKIVGTLTLLERRDPATPTGLLLYGPPGTGKTEIARRLATMGACAFIPVAASDLKSENVGGTEAAVKTLWQRVRHTAATRLVILFIDECDSAFPNRMSTESDAFARSITETFLAEWQGFSAAAAQDPPTVLVIGATNNRERIDPAIISRFGESIEIALPSKAARAGILQAACTEMGIALHVTDAMAEGTYGLAGRDLRTVARSAKRDALAEHTAVAERHVLAAISALRGRTAQRTAPGARWDALVIPPAIRERLETITGMLRQAEVIQQQGIALPRALIFHGPPGTGKTEIARTLANESGLHFEPLSPADLKGSFVGQTGPKVREAFARARSAAPAILYIDELDVVAPRRDGRGTDAFTADLVGQLLQEMAGVVHDPRPVFVLASTNCAEAIDPAVLSRFTEAIELPLPDRAARRAILHVQLRGKPLAPGVLAALDRLAAQTEGASGRDLRSLVDRAEQSATARALQVGRIQDIQISTADFERGLVATSGTPAWITTE